MNFPNLPRFTRPLIVVGAIALVLLGAAIGFGFAPSHAQMMGSGMHGFGQGQGHGTGMHRHGRDGSGHDMTNMPGLRGVDATPEESAELAVMFNNFESISRSVEILPNGIRTITSSTDEMVMDTLISHVSGMITRVEDDRDPQIFIQSSTLDILFERNDSIISEIEITGEGIVVVQTSDDPEVVAALQTHAGEVSDMADRGMEAVHDMMMRRANN